MGLFGGNTPKGDDPVWYPMKILEEAQALIHTKNVRVGYERELADRLTPYRDMLRHVEMAYEITAYPAIRWRQWRSPHPDYSDLQKYYGVETKERIEDAKKHPGEDIENNPHRGPIALNLAERKLLGTLTQARGLRFDPEKRTYRYADLDNNNREKNLGVWQREMKEFLKGFEHLRHQPKPPTDER